ncbi:hypothetical protein [Microbacterium sp. K24]|uniref:hypothetical protein n=1 Tax=Microbacterium sp. K24 TaxID=2305446 RepID=UPI00109CCC79|nr:hypothetical protein [Microbacterium sp. K24]
MKIKKTLAAAAAIIAAGTLLAGCGIQYDGETTGCTVTDKYVTVSKDKSEKRIATSCGTFNVEDELSQGQWNSADLYARIEVGKTYDFEAYGFRNGFLSAFPNVSDATEVKQ